MTASAGRETAKIYAFPVKVRAYCTDRAGSIRAAATGTTCGPAMDVDGWYHGEAIREAARPCQPRR